MPKPTTLPEWATGASATVTEPSLSQKQAGWAVRQRPPAQYLNWWQKAVFSWLQYVDGLTGEALTWAAKHTFSAGLATPTAPAAGTDVVNKTYADGLVSTLKSGANTWAAKQTYAAGQDVTGAVQLVQAAPQAIVKIAAGGLRVGTAAGAGDLELQALGATVLRLVGAASPWLASTAYAVGARVVNAGNTYECTVAGTSAASGGPSTADPAVADGTATWRYVVTGIAGGLDLGGRTLSNLALPVNAGDAATKAYVDALETSANIWTAPQTFTGGATGLPVPVAASDAATKSYVDKHFRRLGTYAFSSSNSSWTLGFYWGTEPDTNYQIQCTLNTAGTSGLHNTTDREPPLAYKNTSNLQLAKAVSVSAGVTVAFDVYMYRNTALNQ
jgi:hypothetical protein